MKVNRRSFFGVAAAAPIAAKQAASSVLEYERVADHAVAGKAYYGGGAATDEAPPGYWQNELSHALKERKQVEEAGPNKEYATDLAAYIQIDNRRATSPAVRALLIAEEKARRERARELSYLDRRIESLKKKLGPLGTLLD